MNRVPEVNVIDRIVLRVVVVVVDIEPMIRNCFDEVDRDDDNDNDTAFVVIVVQFKFLSLASLS